MPDDYIGKREFDGFGGAVREEFKQLRGDLTQVAAKIDMLLNGKIGVALPNWSKAFLGTAPTVKSIKNSLLIYPRDFSPFRNARRFATNRQDGVVSPVSRLLNVSGPPAIVGAISLVAINPINRM